MPKYGTLVNTPVLYNLQPPCSPILLLLRSLLGGLSGLSSTELLRGSILLRLLCAADGAHTGDGVTTEVTTVAILSGLIGNALVNPLREEGWPNQLICPNSQPSTVCIA